MYVSVFHKFLLAGLKSWDNQNTEDAPLTEPQAIGAVKQLAKKNVALRSS